LSSVSAQKPQSASSFLHARFDTHTYHEGHIPLLASLPHDSIDEKLEVDLEFSSCEYQAALIRPYQEKLWAEECDKRERDITATRLMHMYGTSAWQVRCNRAPIIHASSDRYRFHINPPATDAAKSQKPSMYSAELSTASYVTGTATYEQQTGIIRDIDDPIEVQWEQLEVSDGSSTSSLRRRGAVRRKTNPLFAHQTYEDFE
jgi:hypothetical protein